MTAEAPSHAAKPNWFARLANPGEFLRWSRFLVLPLAIATIAAFAIGLWYALYNSPADYQMGETVRLMYIHVPNAWLSMLTYGVMFVAALGTLIWRHPLADVTARVAAPLGAAFTAMALFSGALWGRPTWGTYWEWDGRMTSTLVLLFIYLGIIALWRAFDDPLRAGRVVAVVTLVGGINIPIVRYSVDWWSTLHQPASILTDTGTHMPGSILTPLLVMMGAFTLLFALLQVVGMRTEILRRRAEALERRQALQAVAQ
jgi:heme exporter protein C